MRYLSLALFAEGRQDHRFLGPLLRRVAERLCLLESNAPVEVAGSIELHTPASDQGRDRGQRILGAAQAALGCYDVLLIHADADGDEVAARTERIDPAIDLIRNELQGVQHRSVGVVPVRETESWALVDGDALRRAFGTSLLDSALGVPSKARGVEGILKPKEALNASLASALGSRRQRKGSAAQYLSSLGELVQITRLREVPAFARFEVDFRGALSDLGFLPPLRPSSAESPQR